MNEKDLSIFLENFDHVDSAFLHPKQGLFGKTLAFDCAMKGPVNHNGFIVDFGWVKKTVKNYLKKRFDHKLIVFRGPEHKLIDQGESYHLSFKVDDQACYYKCPKQALEWIDTEVEDVHDFLASELEKHLFASFDSLTDIKVRCYLPFTGTTYSYTHGLSQHEGACQRLLHGHSTKISSQPNQTDHYWNQVFGSLPHIASQDQIAKEEADAYILKYRGNEGNYELKIPKHRVWVIEPTASIESIAKHLIDKDDSCKTLQINEGISKGARVEKT